VEYHDTAAWIRHDGKDLSLDNRPSSHHPPDIHRDMKPGDAMTLHISVGIAILALTAARLIWRLQNPVAPDTSLPGWQRVTAETVHWLLYSLVLATTVTGWYFASFRGWSISLFFAVPLPLLAAEGSQTARSIGHLHELLEWALLIVIGVHVAAAIAHSVIYRDRILQRMLPG
jgi:cytochrome b561